MTVWLDKKRGGWCAKFEKDGEQIWVPDGPWRTKGEAKAAEQRERDRRYGRISNETCTDFATRWLKEWPRESVSTRRHYAIAVRRFVEEFGPQLLGEVERPLARQWALSVPRNVSKTIATMYQDAYNEGLVKANPFANLRLPVTEKTQEVAPPTLEEFHSLLAACMIHGGYAPEFRALIQFTAWTGLRAAEVQALRWEDIGADTIWVRKARKDDGSYGPPKNGKAREIAFLRPAQVLDQVPRRDKSPFVFHSIRGEALNKGNLYYAWKAVRDSTGTSPARIAEGLQPMRFHDLRHFCATQLLERGNSHFDVSVQLGHEDGGALVMARYGHPSKDAARSRLLATDADLAGETRSKSVASNIR
ncbi:MAG TPA: site-specific integrase [Solirubrobacterales bacterium]|nr:site-specific integrase [Solirubrobacterales bacterium]